MSDTIKVDGVSVEAGAEPLATAALGETAATKETVYVGTPALCAATGCGMPGTKLCSRCGAEAYCSAECQRKAWRVHKLVCQKLDTPENEVSELLRAGRLYSAREKLWLLPKGNARLQAEFEGKVKAGIHSEIVGSRLSLGDVPDFGRGYVAAMDLREGDALLFDTAFAWAPVAGEKEAHFIIAEKAMRRGKNPARRTDPLADAQADFYHDVILATLPLKGGMERSFFDDTLDDEMREQMLACAVAEGCSLWCSEEPDYVALFPAAAWFNHSCSPNASLESSRSTLVVRAAVAISAGVEVTISYLPPALLGDADGRRRRLQGGRGFDCRCAVCAAEGLC